MRKMKMLKGLVVVILSIILVVNISSMVFADDNTVDWDQPTDPNTSNTSDGVIDTDIWGDNTVTTDNTIIDTETTNTNTNTNTNINTNTDSGTAITTLDTDDDENTNTNNSVNSLVYAGIEDNSVLAVGILLGAIVAVYSFKKVKEYNRV